MEERADMKRMSMIMFLWLGLFGAPGVGWAQLPISLTFPLLNQSPYAAAISSVLDHSGSRFYCDGADRRVIAYTGEKGWADGGSDPVLTCSDNTTLNGFGYPASGIAFLINGAALNQKLYYDGHPGYDFPHPRDPDGAPSIRAATSGRLVIPASDSINGGRPDQTPTPFCRFHTFKIVAPGGAWETWYLHSRKLVPRFQDQIDRMTMDSFCSNNPNLTDIDLGPVTAGELIAFVGSRGVNCSPRPCDGNGGYHLHFDVRRNGLIVDPYGWEWFGTDPLVRNPSATVQRDPLWLGIPVKPIITNVVVNQGTTTSTLTIQGEGFNPNALVTLWSRDGGFPLCTFGPNHDECFIKPAAGASNAAGTQIVVTIPVTALNDLVLKVKNESGPRSTGWPFLQACTVSGDTKRPVGSAAGARASCGPGATPTSNALILIGEAADGGGTFSSFAGFDSMNDAGDLVFEAWVDLSGNCTPTNVHNCRLDDFRTFKRSGGRTTRITVPGISRAGTARINDAGDMAVGQLADPGSGFGSGTTVAILLVGRDGAPAKEIARWGQATPLGGTYYQVYGPLALSEDGDVVFQSCILNDSGTAAACNYNWVYRATTGLVTKLVSSGETTSIGGTFGMNLGSAVGFTDDGDVVFPAEIVGGTSGFGIFIAPRNGPIRKVVAANDTAPAPIGGRLGPPRLVVGRPVAGRKLVFVADAITGGSTTEAIIAKDDVMSGTLVDLRVIARKGQATGTDIGGTFQRLSNGAGNPQVRRDGAILFDATLANATVDGQASDWGVFLWTGRETIRVAATGQQLAGGGRVAVGSGHTLNDVGQVRYFATDIQ